MDLICKGVRKAGCVIKHFSQIKIISILDKENAPALFSLELHWRYLTQCHVGSY